jgi:Leucine-rich repeat (LRR) protein
MAYQLAERRIEAARRSGATDLDLSKEQLTKESQRVLGELSERYSRLKGLLSGGRTSAYDEALRDIAAQAKLFGLKPDDLRSRGSGWPTSVHLYMSEKLTQLPSSLWHISSLQRLNASGHHLATLPESLRNLTQLRTLDLSHNKLSLLPTSLGELSQLRSLNLASNALTYLPESLGNLAHLHELDLSHNALTELPKAMGQLSQLRQLKIYGGALQRLPSSLKYLKHLSSLHIVSNELAEVPSWIGELQQLEELIINANRIAVLPDSIGNLTNLQRILLGAGYGGNQIRDLPASLGYLEKLREIRLDRNPLTPELAGASTQGTNAVKAYLRAKTSERLILNEAKLILIGEGEVGKTSLLGALRGDDWVDKRPTTHGVEVDIKTITLTDAGSGKEITFNGWDFGGQSIYRHTHQLFFTAPAIYLAVWNPRRGPEQCRLDEWVKMVRQRAFDDTRPDERPRILVVATHGGPQDRLDHIDEQALRDEFGDLVVGFHHVDSRPDEETGICRGLDELKAAVAREAAAIPSVGRHVPKSWKQLLDALQARSATDPYITYAEYLAVCDAFGITGDLAGTYAAILNELGHLIHYQHDEILRDTMILKPEFISKAVSYVLEDRQTKQDNGLVHHARLGDIWNDPSRLERDRYPADLHPIFLRLMDRFDLSYQVAMPRQDDPPTSLIAQLVPGRRPAGWEDAWPQLAERGDVERRRICRMVDVETGRPAEVEGLLYRLIVRLHRFSLGRHNYFDSLHWKTGLILDDDFNGRAFIEEIAGDVHITVRAAYPDGFLGSLCNEVRSLVEQFWKGLDCRLSVPCRPPCKGLHELADLVETKREGISKIRCSVCKTFHDIDSLLVAATPKQPLETVLSELTRMRGELANVKEGVSIIGAEQRAMIGQANEQFDLFMQALTDPAKDGPRLFSFEPVEPGFWDKPKWIAEQFRLTLWCEHARLPLPELTGDAPRRVRDRADARMAAAICAVSEVPFQHPEPRTAHRRAAAQAGLGRRDVPSHRGPARLRQELRRERCARRRTGRRLACQRHRGRA